METEGSPRVVMLTSRMTSSKVYACALLGVCALVTICAARPREESLIAVGKAVAHRTGGKDRGLPARIVRRDWMDSLTEEERQYMSKYIPQMLAELSNSEGYNHVMNSVHPIIDRDYNGWMDFGRRSTGDGEQDS
ncbi:gastrin/cholecystokinin-like peptide isoform X1 [Polypterus senegalus]|nr:gastrin/cholecystokinin-like peptide isoform X1 [Polypterus senegalus]